MTDIPVTQKKCTKCGEVKPFASFHKKRHGKYGLRGQCIDCTRQYSRDNAEAIRLQKQSYYRVNRENILARQREYNSANKHKKRAYYIATLEANRQKILAYRAKNRERILQKNHASYNANKQFFHERQRLYRVANKEKIRYQARKHYEANSKIILERRRAYYTANPDVFSAGRYRRKMRLKANGGHFTAQQIREMRAAQAGVCVYCQRQYEPHHLQIEHIIPVSKGGSNDISNICLACRTCNYNKHDRTPEQWTDRWYTRPPRPRKDEPPTQA